MKKSVGIRGWLMSAASMCVVLVVSTLALAGDDGQLLDILQSEQELSMQKLTAPDGTKPYFIQYAVTHEKSMHISATLGALTDNSISESRMLDVDLRCGDYALDNTHKLRDAGRGGWGGWGGWTMLPLDGDPLATRHAVWLRTDEEFKEAVKNLAQVKANVKVKVEEEDQSDDFSREEPNVSIDPVLVQEFDREHWADFARKLSAAFKKHPKIFGSSVTISGEVRNITAVNTEGSKLRHGQSFWRIGVSASTIADDGMELSQFTAVESHTPDSLPGEEKIAEIVDQVIADILALRNAPVVEPYTGPAILMNRASGVFFHEIFGHRLEGHRQKDSEEGQTFAKKLGKSVLPDFINVYDDPTMRTFGDTELHGFYKYDDECVKSQKVLIVEDGILKTFLMSRSPTRGVVKSNGHGRRQAGMDVVARQGNLIIESQKQVPMETLREMLIAECKAQGKDFGLMFTDISGGFTTTRAWSPQAYKVNPIKVFKIFTDGRPDELVRGVDICGTPLTSFENIIATGDDPDVFNGMCGAESGSVPVSAISPSLLVKQIEIERKRKAQDRAPILTAPIATGSTKTTSN